MPTKKKRQKRSPSKRSVRTKRTAPRRSKSEARPDERLVLRTVEKLHEHDRAVTASMRDVGETILADYFGGDEELAQSNSPVKAKSYARLAALASEETEWKEEDLRRAVKLAIVAKSLPDQVASAISTTRLLRIAGIDDPAKRREFAAVVARGEMSEPEFRARIAPLTGERRRGGRIAAVAPVRFVAMIESAVETGEEIDAFDADQIARIPETALPTLERRLRTAIGKLEDLLRAVRARS